MINELLRDMEHYAAEYKIPIIPPATASLLAELVRSKQPRAVLEIGTAIGYSTIVIALSLPPGASIVTIEREPARIDLAQAYISRAGFSDRVRFVCADAASILPCLSGKFDMVFIDAAKGQYLDHLIKVLDKLVPGATVVADNVMFRGMVDGEAPRRFRTIVRRLKEYLHFVTSDPRFTTEIYPIGDGIAVSCYQGEDRT